MPVVIVTCYVGSEWEVEIVQTLRACFFAKKLFIREKEENYFALHINGVLLYVVESIIKCITRTVPGSIFVDECENISDGYEVKMLSQINRAYVCENGECEEFGFDREED
jgi:hypothetical protein